MVMVNTNWAMKVVILNSRMPSMTLHVYVIVCNKHMMNARNDSDL